MAGPRDTDWTHIRVIGDRGRASAYIPDARKVLGFVKQEAARNGLKTYKKRVVLPDGTVLIGEIHGSQPIITIQVPPITLGEDQDRFPEDFVVIARNQAFPDGIDTDRPQQILRPTDEDPAKWRTFFWDIDITGYDSFDKPKGTYRFKSGVELFPDGATYAGNVDWRSKRNVRVSWYGPTLRYWYDRFRQPSAQYSKHVFMLGQILLDIDQYCTDSSVSFDERLVLGACFVGNKLFVMQAEIDDQPTSYSAPATARKREGICSDPYPVDAIKLRLVRYTVIEEPGEQGVDRFKVADNSDETLWTDELAGFVNPWFFNQDGTVVETFSMPEVPKAVHYRWDDLPGPDIPNDFALPSLSSFNLQLTIEDDDSVTENSIELSVDPSDSIISGPIAADYDDDGNRVELAIQLEILHNEADRTPGWETDDYFYYTYSGLKKLIFSAGSSAPDEQVIFWDFPDTFSIGANMGKYGTLLGIDLRHKSFFTWQWRTDQLGPGVFNDEVEFRHVVYHTGKRRELPLIGSDTIENFGQATNTNACIEFCYRSGISTVSPLFYLMGVVVLGGSINDVADIPIFFMQNSFITTSPWFMEDELYGFVGQYDDTGANPGIIYEIKDLSNDLFFNNKEDRLSHKSSAGYAVNARIVMYSGISFEIERTGFGAYQYNYVQDHYVTGKTLTELTGIPNTSDDEKARFHPLWLLGVPPK